MGAITLSGTSTLATNNSVAAGSTLTLGAVTGSSNNLSLNAGTGGAISGSSFNGTGTLTLTNAASVAFSGAVTANTLATAAQAYTLQLNGGSTITTATNLLNSGANTFGGTNTFIGGLISTAASNSLNGTVQTMVLP
jgi:hypothetical protein